MSLTITITAPDGRFTTIEVPEPIVIAPVASATAVYEEVDNPPGPYVLPDTQVGAILVKDAQGNVLTPANWPEGVVAIGDPRFKVERGGWSGYSVATAVIFPDPSPDIYVMLMTTDP
jgi:hypothetical protein